MFLWFLNRKNEKKKKSKQQQRQLVIEEDKRITATQVKKVLANIQDYIEYTDNEDVYFMDKLISYSNELRDLLPRLKNEYENNKSKDLVNKITTLCSVRFSDIITEKTDETDENDKNPGVQKP